MNMEIGMILSLVFVIICPFAYAFVNIFDKYIVSYRIKRPLGVSALSCIPIFLTGGILFILSDWSKISLNYLIAPIFGGIFAGLQYYLYFFLMKHEDASNFSGMIYFYPVIVAILSFFILHERLGMISYLGLAMVIFGVLRLSLKSSLKSFRGFLLIFLAILSVAAYEFSAKITVTNLPIINGMAITLLFTGLTIIQGLFFKDVRKDFFLEMKNLKWVFATEFITLIATLTLFLSLYNLSATIVSTIASIQPLIVLFYERIAEKKLLRISKHGNLLPKLIPIIFIVIGVAMLYLQELLK